MRSVSRRRAAEFVRPALTEPRIARMWSAIAEAERARIGREGEAPGPVDRAVAALRARRGWAGPLLAAAALAAALLLGVRRWPPAGPTMTGLVIDTGSATQEVSLTEGSTLRLAAATRVRVISATAGEFRLRLEHGSVMCDVVHREGRRFVVEAGGVEVEDRGTRFVVDVTPGAGQDAVAVHVERGAVEVHDVARAVLATLGPGQAWGNGAAEAVPAPDAPGTLPRPSGEPVAEPEPPPPSSAAAEHLAPPAKPVVAPSPRVGPAGAGSASHGEPSPEVLFERADAARLAGRHADAAADFERFYRRFPDDPRAGLAAYELGRIRLRSLRDPRGAVEAFGAALQRPEDPFREDAEAGRVEAFADLGDDEGCKRARDAFRARYPRSPQARRVAKLCGGP